MKSCCKGNIFLKDIIYRYTCVNVFLVIKIIKTKLTEAPYLLCDNYFPLIKMMKKLTLHKTYIVCSI